MPGPCDPTTLPGRRVLVVGLGRTGASLAHYLTSRGARVRMCDRRPDAPLPGDVGAGTEIVRGTDGPEQLAGIELVIPSPGVPADAPLLRAAVQRGIPVRSEIELAAAAIRAPLIAITGTNGKSTTTMLIGEMLQRSGRRTFTGGNLGTPLIDAADGAYDVVVAEISSFQLEWVQSFHPRVGLLLNVTDDHLDRYRDFAHYRDTKARLFARQGSDDVAILNRDDDAVLAIAPGLRADVRTFGSARLAMEVAGSTTFAGVDGDALVLHEREREQRFSLTRTALHGQHNRENLMAALLAARAFDVAPAVLQDVIDSFRGLRHRLETVRQHRGVAYVDDSKGTNVGALLKSLEGYRDGNVVLIAGGLAKGGDYAVARPLLARKVRRAVLYGTARGFLAESWGGAVDLESHERFADAVRAAIACARAGDVVLLSPACASMDQFKDYAARGDAFAALVQEIPSDDVVRG